MSRRAYAIIIASFFTVSIAYSIRYGYGMLLPEMLPSLGFSKTQAGTIFGTYFVVYTIFTPVLGTLSDLFNYRLLLTVFAGILGLGALLMAYVTGFAQDCLFFALAGLGHAACWAPVASLVQKWVPDHKRGMMLSIVSIGIGIGVPLWGTILPVIVSAFSGRALDGIFRGRLHSFSSDLRMDHRSNRHLYLGLSFGAGQRPGFHPVSGKNPDTDSTSGLIVLLAGCSSL